MNKLKIGNKNIGDGEKVYIIAEVGINHNGDIEIAKKLIDVAITAGCDAVKFQKRNPEICVPPEEKDKLRETPWGTMTYYNYRLKMEFNEKEYDIINKYCHENGIEWFASCWDIDSLKMISSYDVVAIKIPSAMLVNHELLMNAKLTHKPVILSTGMSTAEEIDHAISFLDIEKLVLMHTTSSYPCSICELNLNVIKNYVQKYNFPIGYSGHEVGLPTTYAAVVLGARMIERHITLDRAMWGTDHAASIEPQGLVRLVRDIRNIEIALGDGIKKVYESEYNSIKKLRYVKNIT